jgi:hypothetical protein
MPFNDLLGDVEHAVEVGGDHRIPVGLAHLAELAVTRDTGVVHQHAHGSMVSLDLVKSCNGRVPIAHVADGRVEGVAQRFLLVNPFGEVACGTATCNDLETFFVQTLADGGTDTTHTAGYICYFF